MLAVDLFCLMFFTPLDHSYVLRQTIRHMFYEQLYFALFDSLRRSGNSLASWLYITSRACSSKEKHHRSKADVLVHEVQIVAWRLKFCWSLFSRWAWKSSRYQTIVSTRLRRSLILPSYMYVHRTSVRGLKDTYVSSVTLFPARVPAANSGPGSNWRGLRRIHASGHRLFRRGRSSSDSSWFSRVWMAVDRLNLWRRVNLVY